MVGVPYPLLIFAALAAVLAGICTGTASLDVVGGVLAVLWIGAVWNRTKN